MKIAIFITSKKNTGSISVFKDLINELMYVDSLKIDLYFFDNSSDLQFNCNCTKIKLYDILNYYNYDIVHSTGFRPDLFVTLNKYKFSKNTRFLTTIHSIIPIDLKNKYGNLVSIFFTKIWYIIINKFDVMVVLTNSAKNFYSEKINSDIKVINNGRSDLKLHPIPKEDQERIIKLKKTYKIIGTHAKVSKIKGLDQIIQSLVELDNYAFVVVGDGPEISNLIDLANKLFVIDRCLFLGYRENIKCYFSYYDVFSMPSISEGLPMSLLEAVSCKVPCLTSNIEPFQEIFTDDEVIKFQIFNTKDFIRKIKLIEDKELMQKNVDNAYKKYINKYSSKIMAKNYLELYYSLK